MLDACITSRKLPQPLSDGQSWSLANPNEVKFHMDRDQVAKCAQQCNMKKRTSTSPTKLTSRKRQASRRAIDSLTLVYAHSWSYWAIWAGRKGGKGYGSTGCRFRYFHRELISPIRRAELTFSPNLELRSGYMLIRCHWAILSLTSIKMS